jgi:outer membrane protein OmpA-like peptidoglycan-associated protein
MMHIVCGAFARFLPAVRFAHGQLSFRSLRAKFGILAVIAFCMNLERGTANVIGSDMQNFNPSTNGIDFVTVQSATTLEPGVLNLGLFFNYAANTLPYFDRPDGQTQSRLRISDRLLNSDLMIGYGLLPNLDLGLSLPYLLHQKTGSDGFRGQFAKTGLTEIRFNVKWRLWGDDAGGIALLGSTNINQTKGNPYVGQDAGPTWNGEVALSRSTKGLAFGLNFGYRWRNPGKGLSFADTAGTQYPVEPLRDQWTWSGAISAMIPKTDAKVIGEIFGAAPIKKTGNQANRLRTSAESLFGVKYSVRPDLDLHAGVGTEIQHGLSSPDWRIYTGLNWNTGGKPRRAAPAVKTSPEEPFGPAQKEEKITIHSILFEFDSDSMVLKGSADTIAQLHQHLQKAQGFKKLIIEGHTDSVGTHEYNKDLSQRRANTIRQWLINKHHLSPAKMESEGKGETEPIADNGNYQGRQMNRRVVFRVYR